MCSFGQYKKNLNHQKYPFKKQCFTSVPIVDCFISIDKIQTKECTFINIYTCRGIQNMVI